MEEKESVKGGSVRTGEGREEEKPSVKTEERSPKEVERLRKTKIKG